LAQRLARTLARVAFALAKAPRRRLEENLGWLAGPATRPRAEVPSSQARAAFEHFALSVTDFLRLSAQSGGEIAGEVEVRGREHLAAAQESGSGVIVLSAHAGCWERGAAYLAALGRPVHVVARAHASPSVERFFARRRERWRVFRLCGGPLWLAACRALRRREWVALAGDRNAGLQTPAARGGRSSLCAWVAALSRRTGAMVLPAVMLRLGDGRYAACFERPLAPDARLNQGYRDALRRLLADHAEQWSAFEALPEWLA
jgi:KDO2-lipid IV(A) lauroyltransferase